MFLKLLSNGNSIKNRFSFFINFLSSQCKTSTFIRSEFQTATFEIPKSVRHVDYYRNYLMSEPGSYPLFQESKLLRSEVESDDESFKLLKDLIDNLEHLSSDEIHKTVVNEFSTSDVNEFCKRVIFIDKGIAGKQKNANLLKLKNSVIEELWKKSLPLEELLKFLIFIHDVKYLKANFFKKKIMWKLFKKIERLTPQQVVQLFFAMPNQNLSKTDYKYLVFLYLNNNISTFNANELGVITYGIRKGNLTFNNSNITNAIFSKIIDNIKHIHPVPLKSMCKVISKGTFQLNPSFILDFKEKALPYVSNFNKSVIMDLLELGINNSCINSTLWEIINRKFKENITDASCLFINRLVKQMILHNIKNEEILMLATKKFDEYKNEPNIDGSLIEFLENLTYYKLYPQNLLDIVLSEEFVSEKILSSKCCQKVRFHWWILYCNLEMEKPEYINYSLNIEQRLNIYKSVRWLCVRNYDFNKNIYKCCKFIKNDLKNLYGENAVVKTPCLPQYEDGLVLRFNKHLKAEPIPDNFNLENKSYAKKPLDDDNYWIFLNVISFYQYLKPEVILLHHQTQMRLLKALGYIPIMVSQKLYNDHVSQNTQDKFIPELIQKSLEEAENLRKKIKIVY